MKVSDPWFKGKDATLENLDSKGAINQLIEGTFRLKKLFKECKTSPLTFNEKILYLKYNVN